MTQPIMGAKLMVFERAFRSDWKRWKCGRHCATPGQPQSLHCMGCHVAAGLHR